MNDRYPFDSTARNALFVITRKLWVRESLDWEENVPTQDEKNRIL